MWEGTSLGILSRARASIAQAIERPTRTHVQSPPGPVRRSHGAGNGARARGRPRLRSTGALHVRRRGAAPGEPRRRRCTNAAIKPSSSGCPWRGRRAASSTPRWRGAWCPWTPTWLSPRTFRPTTSGILARSSGCSTSIAAPTSWPMRTGPTSGRTTSRSRCSACWRSGTRGRSARRERLFATSHTVADRLARFNGLTLSRSTTRRPCTTGCRTGPVRRLRLLPHSAGAKQAPARGRCRRRTPRPGSARSVGGTRQDCGTSSQPGPRPPVSERVDLLGFVSDDAADRALRQRARQSSMRPTTRTTAT